jgi:hypothetical protein
MMKNIEEVRYLDTKAYNVPREKPLKDTETIRVYHGFYSYETALEVLKKGLSGKERARRIYSFESGNNPYGLFVTVDFESATKFASSGIIIEFSTKVSDLEAPVWVGGRSYFVQGEYTKSFKDLDEREQQRLLNRQRAGESPYDSISKSDRPELAETLFDNAERQALYIGDLNPNMIKRVWYNETRHIKRLINGPWEKYSVKEFLNYKKENKGKKGKRIEFYPNDNFTIEKFSSFLDSDEDLKIYLDQIINYDLDSDYTLKQYGFWPKQIKQLRDLHSKGYFDKYLNESKLIKENDSEDIYEYEEISDGKFEFTTEKGTKYIVNIIKQGKGIIFNYTADGSFDTIVNEGNMYKVLRTVFTAIKEYTNKNKWVTFIAYLPVRKSKEDIKNNVRHKLYLRFLRKFYNFTDKDIKIKKAAFEGDYYVFVYIKNNINESKLINIIKEELDDIKKELGSGHFGKAIRKGNKVFKITKSVDEYALAEKIKQSGKIFETLPKIYETRKLKDDKFLIVREFIKEEISDELGELVGEEIYEIIEFFFEKTDDIKKSNTNLTELFDLRFLEFLETLKKEIKLLGYRAVEFDIEGLPNNIGIDKNNNYKLFDF